MKLVRFVSKSSSSGRLQQHLLHLLPRLPELHHQYLAQFESQTHFEFDSGESIGNIHFGEESPSFFAGKLYEYSLCVFVGSALKSNSSGVKKTCDNTRNTKSLGIGIIGILHPLLFPGTFDIWAKSGQKDVHCHHCPWDLEISEAPPNHLHCRHPALRPYHPHEEC